MAADDTSGPVTICSRGQSGLLADDLGVTLRSVFGDRRIAWSDISHFTDGAIELEGGGFHWVLVIVLRAGRTRKVSCTSAASAAAETLAAVRQVAERYKIPADLIGFPMRDGRPPKKGMYEDPGGQAGLRYWDGSRWSPLLPPGLGKGFQVQKSTARWAELPVPQVGWDYPAIRATRSKAWIGAIGFLIAAQIVAALAYGWAEQHSGDDVGSFFTLAAITALFLIPPRLNVERWKKIANAADGPFNAIATDDTAPADLGVSLAGDGGPSSHADGLPVPRRASAALAYPLAFATLACGVVSTGVGIDTIATPGVPGLTASILGYVASALAFGGGALLSAKVSPARGGRGRTVANVGFVLGFIGFFILSSILFPDAVG